jgi:signal transduction histidine kinase
MTLGAHDLRRHAAPGGGSSPERLAALRRVAAVVARGERDTAVFATMTAEAAALLEADATALVRFREHDTLELLAGWAARADVRLPVGETRPAGAGMRAMRTAPGPWRFDAMPADAAFADVAAALGVTAVVGVPVTLGGAPWGVIFGCFARPDRMRPDAADRLAGFTELVSITLVEAERRAELDRLIEEQAALRRVAELVARGAGEQELFQAVATEASRIIDRKGTTLMRALGDGEHEVVAIHGGPVPAGTRVTIAPDDEGVVATIMRTRRPVRQDAYQDLPGRAWARDDFGVGSAVGVPIVLDGEVWGVLGVTVQDGPPLPDDAELRLEQFAQLVAAALANAQARDALRRVAEEQAALRRVTELVARGVPGAEVLGAVTTEASALLSGATATLLRFEPGHEFTIVSQTAGPLPDGLRVTYLPDSVADRVRRTGRGERIDDYAAEPDAEQAVELRTAAAVHVPVVVGGRVWGMLSATSADGPLASTTEARLGEFAELASTAIAAIESREQLQASRARLVAATDETRRRVQRDLHDGAQQRLVQSVITLKLAKRALPAGADDPVGGLIDEALDHAQTALADVRDLSRGILPGALTRRGLPAGVRALAVGLPVAVEVGLDVPRLPASVETTAYFVVAEALTNVVKHAEAGNVAIIGGVDGDALWVEVRDDGRGGVDPAAGSGLTGLRDRVEALGGTLAIAGPAGAGTTLRATLPLATPAAGA